MKYDFNNLDHIEDFAECELLHGYEGPVDRFVAIARAMDICAAGTYTPNDVANGLDKALSLLELSGTRRSTEFAHLGY